MAASKRSAATIYELLNLRRYDDTIMMASKIGHEAHWLQRVLCEDEDPALQTLKPAEDLEHILAIVGNGHGLAVWANVVKLLDDLPRCGIDDTCTALPRLRIQNRYKHL